MASLSRNPASDVGQPWTSALEGAISAAGNPESSPETKVIKAPGFRLHAEAKHA